MLSSTQIPASQWGTSSVHGSIWDEKSLSNILIQLTKITGNSNEELVRGYVYWCMRWSGLSEDNVSYETFLVIVFVLFAQLIYLANSFSVCI